MKSSEPARHNRRNSALSPDDSSLSTPGQRISNRLLKALCISRLRGAWKLSARTFAFGFLNPNSRNQPSARRKCDSGSFPFTNGARPADVVPKRASSLGYPGSKFSEDQARIATVPPGFTTRVSSLNGGNGSQGPYPTQSVLHAQSKALPSKGRLNISPLRKEMRSDRPAFAPIS